MGASTIGSVRYIGSIYRWQGFAADYRRVRDRGKRPITWPLVKLGLAAAAQRRPGEVDYRLERQRALAAYRTGAVSELSVCDAQTELLRNASFCGTPTGEPCPICDDCELVHVTYVFGPRLPASGRCISSRAELARLAKRKSPYTGYVVEVCTECGWNHLVRSYLLNPLA
jgi:hypothetical protein